MRIFLADLGHNLLTLSSDVYPLGIANLGAWLKVYLPDSDDVEVRLFREPQDLKAAIDEAAPDVLALSNYTWNEELSLHFAHYVKRVSPSALTLMGGPNWPLTDPVQAQFLQQISSVDAYIDGPTYEGERAFLNGIERFREAGCTIEGLLEGPVSGLTWFDKKSKTLVKGGPVPRITDLDEIPSPYLGGWLDPWFDTGYMPMMQITRGCPFTCTFCNSGVTENTKVHAHSIDNVKQDLLYIAERVKPEIALCLADDNFGMYERDEEIADYFAWLQDRFNWPRYVRTTTGKNKGDRIIRVLRKSRGVLPMTSAVQSMNPTVLKNIKRSNIKLETYAELQEELQSLGMQSYGELILCLPGETKESFMSAVEKFLDAGALRVSAHQLMLLHGAELANPDSRERFQFDTKWRLVARNIGDYTGEPVVEVEEMVVSTPDISYAEYIELRTFHLLLTIYYYEGNFTEAFEFARGCGVSPFTVMRWLSDNVDRAPQGLLDVLAGFTEESEKELFDSRDACIEWAKRHYAELVDGTLGGNLLSKYSMMGRFYATHAALDFLEDAIQATTDNKSPAESEAVMTYLRKVVLHVPFKETMADDVHWVTAYDVEKWAEDGYRRPLEAYAFEAPCGFKGEVADDRHGLISSKVDTFGEHPSGLGKFTRTMFARDLRRTFVRQDAPSVRQR